MYSGTTLNKHSGNLLGVHQKIDRTARKKLEELAPGCFFPRSRLVLSFEGNNGPDGIKRKSAGCDEPSHFYDPGGDDDQEILKHIEYHYRNLVEALKLKETEKAAFEAAWLAHSLVDGLTPAHHYPYELELGQLREGDEEAQSLIRKKMYIKGSSKRDSLRKNWAFWGTKGLLISHAGFEFGVASISALGKIKLKLSKDDAKKMAEQDVLNLFKLKAQKIDELDMFERFLRSGWSPHLANQTKKLLLPQITELVTVVWYKAIQKAKK